MSFSEAYRQQQEQLQQRLLQIKEILDQITEGHETVGSELGAVSVAANTVREDLTTRRDRVLRARGHVQSSETTLNGPGAIINSEHADAVNARVELVDAQFGLDTASATLGQAAQAITTEGEKVAGFATEATANGAAFAQLASDIDDMLRLSDSGRTII